MSGLLVPVPRVPVNVRLATPADVPFIDRLQKTHAKMVGFMPAKQIEGKVAAGQVLVAEEVGSCQLVVGSEDASATALPTTNSQLPTTPLGYVIATDRYFKHDDVGIVYQLNVVPGRQRGFIGAALLKATFDRAAWGCKLFCCWCAQDIEANRFWEAMGFVPLAFRAGSEKKGRVHIFWQKRIRSGDTTTPWWFPAKTDAGAMREDRLVLPIPPGVHWSDEMPVLTPKESLVIGHSSLVKDKGQKGAERATARDRTKDKGFALGSKCGPQTQSPTPRAKARFGAPGAAQPAMALAVVVSPQANAKPARVKKKADPKLVAAARELRDRWLEHVNGGGMPLEVAGKYDLARALPQTATASRPTLLLPAA